jgi:hypothetical protein
LYNREARLSFYIGRLIYDWAPASSGTSSQETPRSARGEGTPNSASSDTYFGNYDYRLAGQSQGYNSVDGLSNSFARTSIDDIQSGSGSVSYYTQSTSRYPTVGSGSRGKHNLVFNTAYAVNSNKVITFLDQQFQRVRIVTIRALRHNKTSIRPLTTRVIQQLAHTHRYPLLGRVLIQVKVVCIGYGYKGLAEVS